MSHPIAPVRVVSELWVLALTSSGFSAISATERPRLPSPSRYKRANSRACVRERRWYRETISECKPSGLIAVGTSPTRGGLTSTLYCKAAACPGGTSCEGGYLLPRLLK